MPETTDPPAAEPPAPVPEEPRPDLPLWDSVHAPRPAPVPMPMNLPSFRHVIIAGILLLCSLLSLLLAYGVFGSRAWEHCFTRDGWKFEGLRVLIGIPLTLAVLGCLYPVESATVLPFQPRPGPVPRASRRVRLAFRVVLALAVVLLLVHHLIIGPRVLARAVLAGDAALLAAWSAGLWEQCVLPYAAYALYSFVNMICILFVLVWVTCYGGVRDLERTSKEKRALDGLLAPIVAKGAGPVPPATQAALVGQLGVFAGALLRHLARSSYLILAVGVLWCVEWHLCWQTLSAPGRLYAIIGYSLIALGATSVIPSYLQYEEGFHTVLQYLPPGSAQKGQPLANLRPLFVLLQARRYVAGVFIICLIVAGPAARNYALTLWAQAKSAAAAPQPGGPAATGPTGVP